MGVCWLHLCSCLVWTVLVVICLTTKTSTFNGKVLFNLIYVSCGYLVILITGGQRKKYYQRIEF